MNNELVMDQRIIWDSKNLKEVDEAKARIMAFKRQGYEILLSTGVMMERFRPYYEEVIVKAKKIGKHVMKILCDKGDERIVWDRENGLQAKEAKVKFQELIGKSYSAYSVDSQGKKNMKIEEFDIDAEEILMVPPTAKG